MRPRDRFVGALAAIFVLGASLPTGAQAPAPLTLAEALRMIEAAQKDARSRNVNLSIAVVDSRGDLIAIGRMPGAGANTPDTAIGKAMMSAIYGEPSAALVARSTSPTTRALNEASGGRLRFLQGAVPIIRNGYVVGGVGASGAASAIDEGVSTAALAALAP